MQKFFFCQHQLFCFVRVEISDGTAPIIRHCLPPSRLAILIQRFSTRPKAQLCFLRFWEKLRHYLSWPILFISLYFSFHKFSSSVLHLYFSQHSSCFVSLHSSFFFFIFTFCYYYTHHPRLNPSSSSPIQPVREHRYSFAVDFDQFLLTVELSILYSAYCLLFFIYRV